VDVGIGVSEGIGVGLGVAVGVGVDVGAGGGETSGIVPIVNVPLLILFTGAEKTMPLVARFMTVITPAEILMLTASNMASSPVLFAM
jgi:hypothetical protein